MFWVLLFLIPVSLVALTWIGSAWIERRHRPRGSFLSTEIGRLHFTDVGQGNAIILLHGASANGQDFDASIGPALAATYRVVTPDRPGMGHSTRPGRQWATPLDQANAIRELISHLELDRPLLVAHSWSGALALAYLLHYPREVSGAVLLSPAAHSWHAPPAIYNRVTRWPLIGPLFTWLFVFPLGYLGLDSGIRSVFRGGRVPQGYRRRTAIDLLLRPGSWRSNADDLCLLNRYLADQGRFYGWINHPLLSIIGDHDTVVSNEIHTMALRRQLPGMTVFSLAECGHAPHHEHPEVVCRLIRDFADRARA